MEVNNTGAGTGPWYQTHLDSLMKGDNDSITAAKEEYASFAEMLRTASPGEDGKFAIDGGLQTFLEEQGIEGYDTDEDGWLSTTEMRGLSDSLEERGTEVEAVEAIYEGIERSIVSQITELLQEMGNSWEELE